MTKYEILLEWERGEPLDQPANRPNENFGTVELKFTDGRRYVLNVWTFDFLPLSRYPWPYEADARVTPASFVHPPDLFVDRLDRQTVEAVVRQLVADDELDDEWLANEPFSAWWARFQRTGDLGPVRLGWRRAQLEEQWGEPDDVSTVKADGAASILKYGSVEFHFEAGAQGGLFLIYKENNQGAVELCIQRTGPNDG